MTAAEDPQRSPQAVCLYSPAGQPTAHDLAALDKFRTRLHRGGQTATDGTGSPASRSEKNLW